MSWSPSVRPSDSSAWAASSTARRMAHLRLSCQSRWVEPYFLIPSCSDRAQAATEQHPGACCCLAAWQVGWLVMSVARGRRQIAHCMSCHALPADVVLLPTALPLPAPACRPPPQLGPEVRESRRDELVSLQQRVGEAWAKTLVGREVRCHCYCQPCCRRCCCHCDVRLWVAGAVRQVFGTPVSHFPACLAGCCCDLGSAFHCVAALSSPHLASPHMPLCCRLRCWWMGTQRMARSLGARSGMRRTSTPSCSWRHLRRACRRSRLGRCVAAGWLAPPSLISRRCPWHDGIALGHWGCNPSRPCRKPMALSQQCCKHDAGRVPCCQLHLAAVTAGRRCWHLPAVTQIGARQLFKVKSGHSCTKSRARTLD